MNSKQIMARALEDSFDLNERGEITNHEAVVEALLSALNEAGFAVVPVEPSDEALERGCGHLGDPDLDARCQLYSAYRAMIAAQEEDDENAGQHKI